MARRRSKILSQRELEVMNAVWNLGRASVRQVREELGGEKAGAYTSIATMLKFLEKKSILRHRKVGRTYFYYSRHTRMEEQLKAAHYFLHYYFEGKILLLFELVLQIAKLSETELEGLKTLIDAV